jgi:hydrophobic/amphiphilic exporter-1 (mainly G- bacteria), HAE1 family
MTTVTTVLGLTPMALGIGEGAELQVPMARVVIGGLLSSTLITLVLIPVIYGMVEGWKHSKEKKPAMKRCRSCRLAID